jgi:hypothetical protein
MTKPDRSYYRLRTTQELIAEARYGIDVDWYELALVLAERLEDKED